MKIEKKLFTLSFIICFLPFLQGQNLLKIDWKFNTGDDLSWALPDFDDTAWKVIQAGTDWENQGYGIYDGFAWYRQKVMISESLKKDAIKNEGFVLNLGRIDDSDVTYWNGTILGQTGGMPPDYESGYGHKRVYSIPVEKVNWGGENTIAVRVYDGGGGGGIVEGPTSLSVKGMEELVVIKPVMEREDHLFLNEGVVKFELVIENNLKQTLAGKVRVEAKSDFGDEILELSHELKVRSGKSKTIVLDLGVLDPGFYNLSVALESEEDNKHAKIAIGVRPEEIISPLDRPDEVDTTRVAVEGGSQGGALSFATAALDNKRINVCVPNVPFLSDFRDYFKVARWSAGEFIQYIEEHPEIPEDEIYENLSYIDIKNLAPWIKAPVLMSIGLKDQTCPPHINFAAYNQLTVTKEYLVYPESGHGLPGEYGKVKYDYIRKIFGME